MATVAAAAAAALAIARRLLPLLGSRSTPPRPTAKQAATATPPPLPSPCDCHRIQVSRMAVRLAAFAGADEIPINSTRPLEPMLASPLQTVARDLDCGGGKRRGDAAGQAACIAALARVGP